MADKVTEALRILSHFWLEELQADDLDLVAALPELARTLPATDATALTDLAVEYQRLFGFNLPPYESVFIDPSTMLMAPATERIQALYRQGGWYVPAGIRTGAPDHLGVELLALADWLDAGQTMPANTLHRQHLALWVPPFILALQRLSPQSFYQTLAGLTLDLLLATLPDEALLSAEDLFPTLPPPPVYRGSEEPLPTTISAIEAPEPGLKDTLKRLLLPREAGLFLTREDLARISQALDLPQVVGDRNRMLEGLFRQAAQYDLIPDLFDQLNQVITDTNAAYHHLAGEYRLWTPYAKAWSDRLAATRTVLEALKMAIVPGNDR